MEVQIATDQSAWEKFLMEQRFAPFLQSWTMGNVYEDIGQKPIRIIAHNADGIAGICQGIVVPAKRGKHIMVPYGPVLASPMALDPIMDMLIKKAVEEKCWFIRLSPFFVEQDSLGKQMLEDGAIASPLHLLSEYTWYVRLKSLDRWSNEHFEKRAESRSTDDVKADMRKTTRNLIGRAEREGVVVTASSDPVNDLEIYFQLQQETTKRHGFVPYPNSFIRAQVKHFAPLQQAIVYIARYNNEPVAASVHMNYGGITSYHHGASTQKYPKIPASYLLQWTAISDAIKRGDDIYNFWGIAPRTINDAGEEEIINPQHPFAGVTTFKTGFGGKPLPLMHCVDVPLKTMYRVTRAFEFIRKWKRGF